MNIPLLFDFPQLNNCQILFSGAQPQTIQQQPQQQQATPPSSVQSNMGKSSYYQILLIYEYPYQQAKLRMNEV